MSQQEAWKRTHQIVLHLHKRLWTGACLWPIFSLCLLLVPSCWAISLYVQSQTFEMHYVVLRGTDGGLVVAVVEALKRMNLFCFRPRGWNEMISHAGADMSRFVIFRNREDITDDKMQYLVYLCFLYKKVKFSGFLQRCEIQSTTSLYKQLYPELWLQRKQTGKGIWASQIKIRYNFKNLLYC